jgi:hypothetical protein
VLKLANVQWWTTALVNGSSDQKAETKSATRAAR